MTSVNEDNEIRLTSQDSPNESSDNQLGEEVKLSTQDSSNKSTNNQVGEDLSELENLVKKFVLSKAKKNLSVTLIDIKIYLSKKYKLYVQHSNNLLPILKKLRHEKVLFKDSDKYTSYDKKKNGFKSNNSKKKVINNTETVESEKNIWPHQNN